MKKLLALLMVLTLALPFGALAAETYEIALVTDVGNIDDKSFNQASWEGVIEYATANNKTHAYYRPSEDSNDARVESMKAAIAKGAKIVVLPGYLFADSVAEVQNEYPDVTFIVLDTAPTGEAGKNTYSVLYQEEQAGYLAGYAAVKDGYTKLGFLGGMAVPAVVRFGYGYVQGVEAAAKEMNVKPEIKYWYADAFIPNDDIKTKMNAWFTDGTEVVFACGGGIYLSAIAAAEESGHGKLIGVDKDQAFESPLIITSATKNLTGSVVQALTAIYDNGGKLPEDMQGLVANLGAKDDAVGLPTAKDSWRLAKYTVEEYNDLYAKLKDGSVVVSPDIEAHPAVEVTAVDYQN
jgi:basic membrane protein A